MGADFNPGAGRTGTLVWTDIGDRLSQSVTQLVYTPGSGHEIESGFVTATNQSKGSSLFTTESAFRLASTINGTSDIISIIVQSDSGTQNVSAVLTLLQLF